MILIRPRSYWNKSGKTEMGIDQNRVGKIRSWPIFWGRHHPRERASFSGISAYQMEEVSQAEKLVINPCERLKHWEFDKTSRIWYCPTLQNILYKMSVELFEKVGIFVPKRELSRCRDNYDGGARMKRTRRTHKWKPVDTVNKAGWFQKSFLPRKWHSKAHSIHHKSQNKIQERWRTSVRL